MKAINIFIERITPRPIWTVLLKKKYRYFGRPSIQGETSKARFRRLAEGFFEKYCNGKGLDIGYGGDLLLPECRGWDFEHGDASRLDGINNSCFDFIYSSHTLEHLEDPVAALKRWWQVLKQGGYLILYVPDRDLYEKRRALPSMWNKDHKHFFMMDRNEPPDTKGLVPLIETALTGYEIIYARRCNTGYVRGDDNEHPSGKYSIEVVIRKNAG